MENVIFAAAEPDDLTAIQALLGRCDLPSGDLRQPHLAHFLVCRAGAELAGTVGLEVLGELGLLRSLAVAPELRGRRLGHELLRRALDHAARNGVRRLYLLTTTAEGLFSRWGFRRVARETVPDAVRGTAELRWLCPSTATVMTKDLEADADQRVL